MDIPAIPQSLTTIVYIVGAYVIMQMLKNAFDLWTGIERKNKSNGYKRETDEYVKRFYEAARFNQDVLKECVQLHRNQGQLIEKQHQMMSDYFTSAMEFRVTLCGQVDIMGERVKEINSKVNEIAANQ